MPFFKTFSSFDATQRRFDTFPAFPLECAHLATRPADCPTLGHNQAMANARRCHASKLKPKMDNKFLVHKNCGHIFLCNRVLLILFEHFFLPAFICQCSQLFYSIYFRLFVAADCFYMKASQALNYLFETIYFAPIDVLLMVLKALSKPYASCLCGWLLAIFVREIFLVMHFI